MKNISETSCDDHVTIYTNTELCCTPETNMMSYVNYASKKKSFSALFQQHKNLLAAVLISISHALAIYVLLSFPSPFSSSHNFCSLAFHPKCWSEYIPTLRKRFPNFPGPAPSSVVPGCISQLITRITKRIKKFWVKCIEPIHERYCLVIAFSPADFEQLSLPFSSALIYSASASNLFTFNQTKLNYFVSKTNQNNQ